MLGAVIVGSGALLGVSMLTPSTSDSEWTVEMYSQSGELIKEWHDVKPAKWTPWTMSFDTKDGKRIRVSGNYIITQQ